MIKEAFLEFFDRDLERLEKEIEAYTTETNLWKIEQSIKNSGGNLCLHLVGNIKTYIGNGLGNIGYIRQRDLEFSAKNVAREQLIREVKETKAIVHAAISNLTEEDLKSNYPIVIWGETTNTPYTLLRIHAHLNYHLGQINYHRRILDK